MIETDQKLLALFDECLFVEGLRVESIDIERKYVICIYLQEIYGFKDKELIDYFEENPVIRETAEIQNDLSHSTVWKKRKKELAKEQYHSIRNAAKRAVLNLYFQGITFPERILNEHELQADPTRDVRDVTVPESVEQKELQAWAELFLDDILSPLTFNRAENKSKEFNRFVGLAAQSALQDVSPITARNTARYNYPTENLPDGDTLQTHISDISSSDSGEIEFLSDEILSQFDECYTNFFTLLSSLGVIGSRELLLVDTTKVPSTSQQNNPALLGGSGSGRSPAKYGTKAWGYQFMAVTREDHLYIHSVLPYYRGDQIQQRLDRQLQKVNTDITVDESIVIADKKYYKKDVVKVCREHLDDSWLICAKVGGDVKELVRKTPEGHTNMSLSPDFGDKKMIDDPNMFVYPNSRDRGVTLADVGAVDDYSWKQYTHDTDHRSHIGYLTDMNLNDKTMRKLHVLYQQRDSIESPIGKIKDIYLPYTESNNPGLRFYMMSLAGLFFNTHQLINRSLSPDSAVPLDVTGKEWLTAIRHVALK